MKKALNIEIGARVRESRERLHMSRETLSELLGISTLFLSYIECGQKGMSIETLIRICKTLHVSADYILLGTVSANADRSEAEMLLHAVPDAYCTLSEEALRLFLKTIATVQADCMNAHAGASEKKPSDGNHTKPVRAPQKHATTDSAQRE